MARNKQFESVQVNLGKETARNNLLLQLKDYFSPEENEQVAGKKAADVNDQSNASTTTDNTANTASTISGETNSQNNTANENVTNPEKTLPPKQYRVVKGDTVEALAKLFEITVADIVSLPANNWYFSLMSDTTLTPNIVLQLPDKAVNVPAFSDAVYENDSGTSGQTDGEKEEETIKPKLEIPIDVTSGKRPDIKIWTALTTQQQLTYHWIEVREKFKAANADVKSPGELDAWTRKCLRDGWMDGQEIPSLMTTRTFPKGTTDKGPVFEAYSFSLAWKAAVDYPLQKNVGAYFHWQHKLSDKKGLYQLEYSSNEQWMNLQNNKDHADQVNYNLLASVSENPADKDLIAKILKINSWNDQLLSEEFLLLTNHAQTKMYAGSTDKTKIINGVYTAQTYQDLLAASKTKKDVEKASADRDAKLLSTGIPEDNPYPYSRYRRNGREFRSDRNRLYILEQLASKTYVNGEDALEVYVTDNFKPADTRTPDCFLLLSTTARENILKAYNNEWWLNEEQEKIINLILGNTPSDPDPFNKSIANQKTELNTWLKKINAGKTSMYSDLKGAINDTPENKRTFFDVTENLVETVPGQKPVVDTDYINEILQAITNQTYILVPGMVDSMSEKQILSLTKEQFVSMFNGCYYAWAASGGIITGVDRLVSIWVKANPIWGRYYLVANDLDWMNKLFHMLEDTTHESLRDDLYETIFPGNAVLTNYVRNVVKDHKNTPLNWEVVYAVTPNTIFKSFTSDEQLKIVKELTNSAHTDDTDEKTVIRVLHCVGGNVKGATDEEKKANEIDAKQKFYKSLTTWDPGLEKMLWAFDGRNETLMVQAVNGLNVSGYDQMKKDVKTADPYDKDDKIDSLPPEVFPNLSLAERIDYIKILLGRTDIEEKYNKNPFIIPGVIVYRPEDYTRVGRDDEESLLLILNTCKPMDIPGMLKFLQDDHGSFYSSMQSAIDGDQFKQFHDNLNQLALSNILQPKIQDPDGKPGEMIDNPEFGKNSQKLERLKADMTEQQLAHPKVIPWEDPGIIAQLFGADAKQYGAKWSGDDEITVTWMDTNVYTQGIAQGINLGTMHVRKFKPWELIGVKFLRDDSDLGAHAGELRFMPAVYVFLLKNKQFHQQLMEAIDIAALALGVGELAAAAEFGAILMACVDIALPAGSLIMSSYKDKLPPEVREAWEELNTIIMAYQFIHGGVEAFTAIKGKIASLIEKASKLSAEEQQVIKNLAKDAEGRVMLAEKIENASLTELDHYADLIKKQGLKEANAETNLLLKVEERKAMLKNDETLLAKVKAQQNAIKEGNATITKVEEGAVTVPAEQVSKKTVITFTENKAEGGMFMKIEITEEGQNIVTHEVKVKVKDGELEFKMSKEGEAMPSEVEDLTKNDWVKDRTAEQLPKNERTTLNKKPGKGESPGGAKTQPEVSTPKQDAEILDMLKVAKDDKVATITGKEAEAMLEKVGGNAMYIPGAGGGPGTMVIGPVASKADIYEELLHVAQHKKLGWKALSRKDIIELEIEAQQKMIAYAKEQKLAADQIEEYEQTLERWKKHQREYEEAVAKKLPVPDDIPDAFFSLMKQQTAERRATQVFTKGMSKPEFMAAAQKEIKGANFKEFNKELDSLYDKLNALPEEDLNKLQKYYTDNPTSDVSVDSITNNIKAKKVYDPVTQRFQTPGHVDIPAEFEVPTNLSSDANVDAKTAALNKDKQVINQKALEDAEANRKKLLEEANNETDPIKQAQLRAKAGKESYQAGERGAEKTMRELRPNAKRVFPPDDNNLTTFGNKFESKSGELDQVWKDGEEVFGIEAKGGGATRGTKVIRTPGVNFGKTVEQGTYEYLIETLNEMIKAGGPAGDAALEVKNALANGKFKYLQISQKFDKAGNLIPKTDLLEFKLPPPRQE